MGEAGKRRMILASQMVMLTSQESSNVNFLHFFQFFQTYITFCTWVQPRVVEVAYIAFTAHM